jgi:hypothetical protein
MEEMKRLLTFSQGTWLGESSSSKEVQRAAEAIRCVLDNLPLPPPDGVFPDPAAGKRAPQFMF